MKQKQLKLMKELYFTGDKMFEKRYFPQGILFWIKTNRN